MSEVTEKQGVRKRTEPEGSEEDEEVRKVGELLRGTDRRQHPEKNNWMETELSGIGRTDR